MAIELKIDSKVLWLTGLSGAGKTTIANKLKEKLSAFDIAIEILDGDILRMGINKDLGFSMKDRYENVRRTAEIAKILVNNGIYTLVCLISPTEEIRKMARSIIGEEKFIEVFINAPFEICKARDVKGMYKRVERGECKDFTGLDSPFEKPANPDITIDTSTDTVLQSVSKVLDFLKFNK